MSSLDLANQTGLVPQQLYGVNNAGTQSVQIDNTGVLITNTTTSKTLDIGAGGFRVNGTYTIDPLNLTALTSNPTPTSMNVSNEVVIQSASSGTSAETIVIQGADPSVVGQIFGLSYYDTNLNDFTIETTGGASQGGVVFKEVGLGSSTSSAKIKQGTITSTNGTNTSTINPTSITTTTFFGSLTGNATSATNATNATTATNLVGGYTNSIPYQSSTGTTSYLGAGTTGQVLTTNGLSSAPTWTTITGSQNLAQVLAVGNKAGTTIDMSGNQIVNCEGLTIIDTSGDSSPTSFFNMLKYISSYITQIAPSTNGTQILQIGGGVPSISNYWSAIQSYASSSMTWAVGSASALLQLTSTAFQVNTSLQLTNTNSSFNLTKTETSYPAGATSSFNINTTATASGTSPNSNQNILTLYDLPAGTNYNGINLQQDFTNGTASVITQNIIQSYGGGANFYSTSSSSYDPYLFIQSQNFTNGLDSLLLLTPQEVIITSTNASQGNFVVSSSAGTAGLTLNGGGSLGGGIITCGTFNGANKFSTNIDTTNTTGVGVLSRVVSGSTYNSTHTLALSDLFAYVISTPSSSSINITIPTTSVITGSWVSITNKSTTNTLVIKQGSTTISSLAGTTYGSVAKFAYDGTNWVAVL